MLLGLESIVEGGLNTILPLIKKNSFESFADNQLVYFSGYVFLSPI